MSTEAAASYPIVLRPSGRLCVVVGGGEVALRKVQGLLAAGARVRVVAPQLHPGLLATPGIELIDRDFIPEDLDGAFLVFAATNHPDVNTLVAESARTQGVLVNRVDAPEESDFHLPAVLHRGDIMVTVSSGGGSPAFAARLRDHLAAELGPEWGDFCAIAAALRQKRLTGGEASAYNPSVVSELYAAGLPLLLARQDEAAINRLLYRVTGMRLTLADLGIHIRKGQR